MSRHECKYWQLNIKYHYRYCNFCGRTQYDYGDKWKDQVTLEQFVDKYSKKREFYDVIISTGEFFEYNAYESWGTKIQVTLIIDPTDLSKSQIYGPFPNLNCAMWNIDKKLEESKNE